MTPRSRARPRTPLPSGGSTRRAPPGGRCCASRCSGEDHGPIRLATVEASLGAFSRPVRLLAVGGTIAMGGPRAVPALDAEALVEAVPALAAVPDFGAETLLGSPGPHLKLTQALRLARQASRLAGE